MKKGTLQNVVLLGVLAVLVTWYFLYEKKIKPQNTEAEEKAKKVVSLSKEDINELLIEKNDPDKKQTQKMKFKQTGQEWSLIEPVQDLADSSQISSLLASLTSVKQEMVVAEKPKDLARFGLKEPKLRISAWKTSASQPEQISLGDNAPNDSGTFAKTAKSEDVILVSTSLKTNFDKDLKTLRNKNIIDIPRADISEIEIQTKTENIVLKREKEDWTLARQGLPADSSEVNKFISNVIDLKATDFVSETDQNLSDFGLNNPAIKIYLTKSKDKSRIELIASMPKEKAYVKRGDRKTVFEIEKLPYLNLNRTSQTLQSKELAQFNRFDIKKIRFEKGTDSLELVKKDSEWTAPMDPKALIDGAKIDSWMTRLQDSKLEKFVADKEAKKKISPEITIRLFDNKDNKETEKYSLVLGNKKGNLYFGKKSGMDLVFQIKEESVNPLILKKQDLVKSEEKKPEPLPNNNAAKTETQKKG